MHLKLGNYKFEVDDLWIEESMFDLSKVSGEHYTSSTDQCTLVPISEINPQIRNSSTPIFNNGKTDDGTCKTAKERTTSLLTAIINNTPLPPVSVAPSRDPEYKFKLVAGCHRFHTSIISGFKYIPTITGFDPETL